MILSLLCDSDSIVLCAAHTTRRPCVCDISYFRISGNRQILRSCYIHWYPPACSCPKYCRCRFRLKNVPLQPKVMCCIFIFCRSKVLQGFVTTERANAKEAMARNSKTTPCLYNQFRWNAPVNPSLMYVAMLFHSFELPCHAKSLSLVVVSNAVTLKHIGDLRQRPRAWLLLLLFPTLFFREAKKFVTTFSFKCCYAEACWRFASAPTCLFIISISTCYFFVKYSFSKFAQCQGTL